MCMLIMRWEQNGNDEDVVYFLYINFIFVCLAALQRDDDMVRR